MAFVVDLFEGIGAYTLALWPSYALLLVPILPSLAMRARRRVRRR